MADDTISAVYVSWATFKNAIEGMAQGVPNQIDRSTFPGLSGGVQSQLFSGLKFLGLTNEANKPTPALHALVAADEPGRKKLLKAMLEERYADLFALNLLKTTPQELATTMGTSYNVSGDTRDKAIRFFLSGVTYVGVPVSHLFRLPGENGARTPRKRTFTRVRTITPPKPADDQEQKPTGTSREVKLKSGGTLRLTASLDLFLLTAQDRAFVFGLIDKLDAYEREVEPPA